MKKAFILIFTICFLFTAAVADETEQIFRAIAMMDSSGDLELIAERVSIITGTQIKKIGENFSGEIKLNNVTYKINVYDGKGNPFIKFTSANPAAKFATAAKPVNPFFSVMNEIYGDPAIDRYVGGIGAEGGDTLSTPRTKKGLIDLEAVAKKEYLINLGWQNSEERLTASIFGKRIGTGSHMELSIYPGTFTGKKVTVNVDEEPVVLVSDDPLQKLQIAGKPASCEFGINAEEVINFYKPKKVWLEANQKEIRSWSGQIHSSGRTGIIVSESRGNRSFQYDGTYLEKTEFLCYSETGIMQNGRTYKNTDVKLYGVRMTIPGKSTAKVFKSINKEFTKKYGKPDEESSVSESSFTINGYTKSSTYFPHTYRWQLADNLGIRVDVDTDANGSPLKHDMAITIMRTDIDDKLKR